jgi:hypothetical protein
MATCSMARTVTTMKLTLTDTAEQMQEKIRRDPRLMLQYFEYIIKETDKIARVANRNPNAFDDVDKRMMTEILTNALTALNQFMEKLQKASKRTQ